MTRARGMLIAERFALPIGFVAMLLFFAVWHKTGATFRSSANLQQTASGQAYVGLLALALIIPLTCGEFDLSIGQIAGASQIVCASLIASHGWPLVPGLIVGVLFGAFIGFVNGSTVARLGVNSMIVTLGTSGILLGAVNWYSKGQSIGGQLPQTLLNFGAFNWLGIPRVIWLLAVVALIVWYVLGHTPYGRYLTSVGSNPDAARLVGLRVADVRLSAFVLSGAIAGIAGVLLVAVNGSASPQAGTILDTLQGLAAAFLGATAIKPGRFNVVGTLVAIFFLAFTVQGLNLAGVASYINDVFNGAALFVAVIVSTAIGRHRAGRA